MNLQEHPKIFAFLRGCKLTVYQVALIISIISIVFSVVPLFFGYGLSIFFLLAIICSIFAALYLIFVLIFYLLGHRDEKDW